MVFVVEYVVEESMVNILLCVGVVGVCSVLKQLWVRYIQESSTIRKR